MAEFVTSKNFGNNNCKSDKFHINIVKDELAAALADTNIHNRDGRIPSSCTSTIAVVYLLIFIHFGHDSTASESGNRQLKMHICSFRLNSDYLDYYIRI